MQWGNKLSIGELQDIHFLTRLTLFIYVIQWGKFKFMTARYFYRPRPTVSGKKIGGFIVALLGAVLMYALATSGEYAQIRQTNPFSWWTLTSLWPASVGMVFLGLMPHSKGKVFMTFRALTLVAIGGFAVMMAIGVFVYRH